MKQPYGMTRAMFRAWIDAFYVAGVGPDCISQIIGTAPKSKGYHAQDGTVVEDGKRVAYCCAVDFRTRHLKEHQIRLVLERLAEHGYAGWWRRGRLWRGNTHAHVIYCGHDMKPQ